MSCQVLKSCRSLHEHCTAMRPTALLCTHILSFSLVRCMCVSHPSMWHSRSCRAVSSAGEVASWLKQSLSTLLDT